MKQRSDKFIWNTHTLCHLAIRPDELNEDIFIVTLLHFFIRHNYGMCCIIALIHKDTRPDLSKFKEFLPTIYELPINMSIKSHQLHLSVKSRNSGFYSVFSLRHDWWNFSGSFEGVSDANLFERFLTNRNLFIYRVHMSVDLQKTVGITLKGRQFQTPFRFKFFFVTYQIELFSHHKMCVIRCEY